VDGTAGIAVQRISRTTSFVRIVEKKNKKISSSYRTADFLVSTL